MDGSILNDVKKTLGLSDDYTAFDRDVILHINTVLGILVQLGIGPEEGFAIEDETTYWSDFLGEDLNYNGVKSYVYLRVRLLFDPPATSFHQTAMNEQIRELEWRLNVHRENKDAYPPSPLTVWRKPNPEFVVKEF